MKTSLLIMAAGIGSRFGTGIKQLAKVDEANHIIMDYSIHDAIEAGFDELIFIIRRDIEEEFKSVIENRIEAICSAHNVAVKYAFQDINDIPGTKPAERTKPWGTGQAVLAAKNLINNSFTVINADDYYGKEAYRVMHDWLVLEHEPNAYAMAGFILKNTLSDNGGVTRGVCQVADGHTHLTDVVETSNILKVNGGAEADRKALDPETYVSMNFWGFPGNPPEFLSALEKGFVNFFKTDVECNPLKSEYLLPTIIGGMLRAGECTVKVLPTNDTWYGMTFKEDIEFVQ
ncbi:hypothetical protein EB06_02096 [Enterococcus cecorum]|uniref:sugar phosphate nucleotidyltransferase n=1 Tax=Enterococcus cecorum TaxID=44008 RepID=UPI000DEBC08F|nr:sugar phosphate nucleotidyltransferase [Enterococcus cecorum]RBR27789.1 hypothetical protein EB06_02096 [Enterococcus cecorum]